MSPGGWAVAEKQFQKSLDVHKNACPPNLVLAPTHLKGPKMRKSVQISREPSKLTFSCRGETQFYGQNDFAVIWAFLTVVGRRLSSSCVSALRSAIGWSSRKPTGIMERTKTTKTIRDRHKQEGMRAGLVEITG